MVKSRNMCIFIVGIIALSGTFSTVLANDAHLDTFMERGDKFQGDIVLTTEQEEAIRAVNGMGRSPLNTGLLATTQRWPKLLGKVWVPYLLNPSAGFTLQESAVIVEGLRAIEALTCIRFVNRTFQADYIDVVSAEGCYSSIGKVGGAQVLSLKRPGCVRKRIVSHEFIHALGFDHMQNRDDRDQFVTINLPNVEKGMESNFAKVGSLFGNFGTDYDYRSVMHYSRTAFSINGLDTVVPKDASVIDIIGTTQFAESDATRINNMYACSL